MSPFSWRSFWLPWTPGRGMEPGSEIQKRSIEPVCENARFYSLLPPQTMLLGHWGTWDTFLKYLKLNSSGVKIGADATCTHKGLHYFKGMSVPPMRTKEFWVRWSIKKNKLGPKLGQVNTVPIRQIQEHLEAMHPILRQTHVFVCKISSALK